MATRQSTAENAYFEATFACFHEDSLRDDLEHLIRRACPGVTISAAKTVQDEHESTTHWTIDADGATVEVACNRRTIARGRTSTAVIALSEDAATIAIAKQIVNALLQAGARPYWVPVSLKVIGGSEEFRL